MINLLLLNHFYPVISHGRVQKETESDELLYIRLWSFVMVRNRFASASGKNPFVTFRYLNRVI